MSVFRTFCYLLPLVTLFIACGGGPEPEESAEASPTPEPVEQQTKKSPDARGPADLPMLLAGEKGTLLICEGREIDLRDRILTYADSVQALGIPYGEETQNDCSGTFIKLTQHLNTLCPSAEFPSFAKVRHSRDLIRYYHQNRQLVIIRNPLSSDSLIREGAVMFYALRNQGGNFVLTPDNMGTMIEHVGVVTKVERDPATGRVSNYHLFHGQNPKQGIGISTFHQREPFSDRYKPYPYGNGTQKWVGVAVIAKNF